MYDVNKHGDHVHDSSFIRFDSLLKSFLDHRTLQSSVFVTDGGHKLTTLCVLSFQTRDCLS